MQPDRSRWSQWAHFLQHWGLDGIAAYLLEAGAPVAIVAAQALYLGQPFVNRGEPHNQLQAMAALFENSDEVRSFAAFLREDQHL